MRFLFTSTGAWGTGSFVVIEAVTTELINLGHEVRVIFPDNKDNIAVHKNLQYYSNNNYKIIEYPISNQKISLPSFPLMIEDPNPCNPNPCIFKYLSDEELSFYFQYMQNIINNEIISFQPDVIECQHIWTNDYIMQKLGYPYISVAHHSDQIAFNFDSRMQKYAHIGAQNASMIFAISDYVKQEVIDLYNINDIDKIKVIGNGYNQKIFYPYNAARYDFLQKFNLTIPDDHIIINFAGKISQTKGFDTILEANFILNNLRKDIHIIIFGSGKLDALLKKCKDKNICLDRIHLLGHQPPEIIAHAHNISKFSLVPSRFEGFGISCLEAMGCKIPVIYTNTGGLAKFAIGCKIEPNSPQQLYQAILELINLNSNEYDNLSNKAYSEAIKHSWKKIVEQRLQFYKLLLQKYGKFYLKKVV